MSYADKSLTCRECSNQFVFTAGEQEFFHNRGLTNEPGRCPECRASRRAGRSGYAYTTSSDGFSDQRGERRPREPREMFPATCSACGKDTQVPFQPRTDKPVYCSDCFQSARA